MRHAAERSPRRPRWRDDWKVLALYVGVGLLFLMPMPLRARTEVIQTSGDAYQHMWWLWWMKQALHEGRSPYFTDRIYHPTGIPLYLSGLDNVSGLLSVPLQHVLGLVAAYNVLVLAGMVFSALAMFWLAKEVTGSHRGAIVAGAVLAFCPLMSSEGNMGHLEWTNLGFVPLSVLGLIRLRKGTAWSVVPPAVTLSLAMLVTWYQGLFLIALTVLYAAAESGSLALRRAWPQLLTFVGRVTASWALALVLVSPVLLPAMRLGQANPLSQAPQETLVMSSAKVLDPFLPNALNPFLGTSGATRSCAFGFVAMSLAALGVWQARRRSLFWVAVVAVFYLLSLGPVLQAGDHTIESPLLPYNLVRVLPLGRIPRTPVRFLFVAVVAVSVLVAWGVEWLREHMGSERRRVTRDALVIASLTLVLLESLPTPRPMAGAQVPSFYASLADGPPGAILELPDAVVSRAMYWQTTHGRPIVWGYSSRHVEEGLIIEALPIVRQLRKGTPGAWRELASEDILEQASPETRAAEVLDALGIRYVLLHKGQAEPGVFGPDLGPLRAPSQGTVVWDDAEIEALRIPPRGAGTEGVALGLGQGWYGIERSAAGMTYRWTDGKALLSIVLLDAQARTVRLRAEAFSYLKPRVVRFRLGARDLDRVEVPTTARRITVSLPLVPGNNALYLVPEDPPSTARDGRPLSVGFGRVRVDSPESALKDEPS